MTHSALWEEQMNGDADAEQREDLRRGTCTLCEQPIYDGDIVGKTTDAVLAHAECIAEAERVAADIYASDDWDYENRG